MARYLVHHNPSSAFRKDRQRWRFDSHPVPTIMGQAKGIGGDNDSHWWIEEDAVPESPVATDKPPYRVPSMAEVAAVKGTNGLTVVSTFSGCGGSCLGFEMAGYEVLWASEFVPAAREVYALNHPGVILDYRDIREVKPEEVLAAIGKEAGEVDVLEGSPPCASFSTAGKRQKGWGQVKAYSDVEQRSDDLFFEYARLLRGIQPRAFVAENVSGLVKGVAKGYFLEILKALKGCGYRVEARLLDAQWLGVPQARKRIIFVGVRNDLERDPAFPSPLPYRYSIRDALHWLASVRSDPRGSFGTHDFSVSAEPVNSLTTKAHQGKSTEEVVGVGDNGGFGKGGMRSPDLPASTLGASPNTGNGRFPPSIIEVRKVDEPECGWDAEPNRARRVSADDPCPTILTQGRGFNQVVVDVRSNGGLKGEAEEGVAAGLEGYAVGPEWDKLKPGEASDKYFNLVKSHPDRPLSTLTAAGGQGGNTASVTHPTEKRKFTIAELRRLCAFPDDFQLTGSYAQQWERLGRAVPPLMMRAVAEALRDGPLSG